MRAPSTSGDACPSPTRTDQRSAGFAASEAGTGAVLTAVREGPRQAVHCSADGAAAASTTTTSIDDTNGRGITAASLDGWASFALERGDQRQARGDRGRDHRGYDAGRGDRDHDAADQRQRQA